MFYYKGLSLYNVSVYTNLSPSQSQANGYTKKEFYKYICIYITREYGLYTDQDISIKW